MEAKKRVILALDVSSIAEVKSLVAQLDGVVSFYKVGMQLLLSTGLEAIDWIRAKEYHVFLDAKVMDIDNTTRYAVQAAVSHGVEFLTIHHGVEAAAVAARNAMPGAHLKLLSVPLLTSLGTDDLAATSDAALEDYVLKRAAVALDHGCDGLIISGQNVVAARQRFGTQPIIVCPGIRMDEDSQDDQKRASTPYQAIIAGADYIVVGRPIRSAANPRAKAEAMVAEIERALTARVA